MMPSLLVSRAIPLQIGYDAVGINTVPGSPMAMLGYTDVWDYQTGSWNYQAVAARWPGITVITITTSGQHSGGGRRIRMCDMEFKDLSPAGAAQWAYEEIQLGAPSWDPPTISCQAANGLAVSEALDNVGLRMGIDVPWGMAWWNGRVDLLIPPKPWPVLPMPVYHQYLSIYNQYDIWCALPEWVWPTPPPPPKPKAKGTHMLFETNGVIYDGGVAFKGTQLVPATVTYTPNMKTAYMAEVAAGNQPRPIPDYMNSYYNYYVVGNFGAVGVQVSDLPGEDVSGKIGYPPIIPSVVPAVPSVVPAAPPPHV